MHILIKITTITPYNYDYYLLLLLVEVVLYQLLRLEFHFEKLVIIFVTMLFRRLNMITETHA